jgi:putative spermidine/putrescine transport system permease protein
MTTAVAAFVGTRGRSRLAEALRPRRWHLVLPLFLFYCAFFLSPLLLLVAVSLFTDTDLAAMGPDQYAKFFGDAFNLAVMLDTLLLGFKVMLATVLVGYPIALIFVSVPRPAQAALLFAIVLPLLLSVVVRTFSWIVILGREGVVNTTLLALGLTPAPLALLHTEPGLVLALTQIELPLLLLPLISVMSRIDPSLADASAALGAGRWRTLFKVIMPLSTPGLVAGCMLVFASSTSAFISQSIIGGGRLIYLPLYVWQQATTLFNWPFAAAVSVILLVSVSLILYAFTLVGRYSRGNVHG